MQALVVQHAFGEYRRGDRITDPAIIQQVLSEYPHAVVQVELPDPVPAQTKPAKEG